jgi:hypothetical protein
MIYLLLYLAVAVSALVFERTWFVIGYARYVRAERAKAEAFAEMLKSAKVVEFRPANSNVERPN